MSIHDLKFLQEKVNKLKEDGVYRVLPVLNGKNSSTIVLDGKEMVNLSANNYLGLANDPDLKKRAQEAISKLGVNLTGQEQINEMAVAYKQNTV